MEKSKTLSKNKTINEGLHAALLSFVFCHTRVRLNARRRQLRISNNSLIIHRRVIHNRRSGSGADHTCREHSQYLTQEDEQTISRGANEGQTCEEDELIMTIW